MSILAPTPLVVKPPAPSRRPAPTILLRYREAADELRVSIATIENLVKRDKLTAVYIGASRRISRTSLERYVAELERAAR